MENQNLQTGSVPIASFFEDALFLKSSKDLFSKMPPQMPTQMPSQTPIVITCLTLTGQRVKLDINSNDTVLKLKQNIYSSTDIMLDDQRIIFGGKQLEEANTIDSYNIKNGDQVNLIVRLRGGMFHKTSGRSDFLSLNFSTKFQKGCKMIHGLKQYGIHLDTLAELEQRLNKCETDLEIDKIYELIESVYIN